MSWVYFKLEDFFCHIKRIVFQPFSTVCMITPLNKSKTFSLCEKERYCTSFSRSSPVHSQPSFRHFMVNERIFLSVALSGNTSYMKWKWKFLYLFIFILFSKFNSQSSWTTINSETLHCTAKVVPISKTSERSYALTKVLEPSIYEYIHVILKYF